MCERLLEGGERPVAFVLGDDPWRMTSLADGIRRTLDEFAALQQAGRLDARELGPGA